MDTNLSAALARACSLRFLCSGNMVRSAFAELYAVHCGCALPVDSLATTYRNDGLFPDTAQALRARGVAERLLQEFRPRHMADVTEPPSPDTVVLGMTHAHLASWNELHPTHGNAHLLGATLGSPSEVADPVLDGADFDTTFRTLARAVEVTLEFLRTGA